jgi:hypothetical protein
MPERDKRHMGRKKQSTQRSGNSDAREERYAIT